MSAAQDLHDKIKGLAEEYRGTPGLAYPLAALEGILGHLKAAAKKEASAPSPAPVVIGIDLAVPGADRSVETVVQVPPAKPAPAVQVAKPKPPA